METIRLIRSGNQNDQTNTTHGLNSGDEAQKIEGAWDEAITFMTIIGIIVILIVAFMTYIIVHLERDKPDLSSQLKQIESSNKSRKSTRFIKSPLRLRSPGQRSIETRRSTKSPKSPKSDDATTEVLQDHS